MKIANSRVDSGVVICIRELLLGRTQRVRVGGKLSKEVIVRSGVQEGGVLGPLLFLAHVNDIWKNIDSTIRLFANDCVIYINITNNEDMEKFQEVLDRFRQWAVENSMKINRSKRKAVRTWNLWHRVESYHVYVPSSKHNLEKGRGRL